MFVSANAGGCWISFRGAPSNPCSHRGSVDTHLTKGAGCYVSAGDGEVGMGERIGAAPVVAIGDDAVVKFPEGRFARKSVSSPVEEVLVSQNTKTRPTRDGERDHCFLHCPVIRAH